ncbi:DUF2236 domain-containing protein [Sneathiella sp. P13V-1]|uniref:oxygenase MpaB family protein n=1 Tax=Sneathiella sp. P13V-1 TaxID=2697366 RepID=UPI00187BB024|nr:DUF2236 domain-containing protein [Sneathiella sp. P13V-1]
MNFVRQRIEKEIFNHTGITLKGVSYDMPKGDPGLFGPDSACWQVHRDFTSMLSGGFSALLLQMLHPLALAGVWDHSNFRDDMLGRLKRTAQFVAATTFGNTEDANTLIAKVRAIHEKVEGLAPDGRPYSAMDPELLSWVHVAESYSFLNARQLFFTPKLSPADQDRYFKEYAHVARELGAENVPTSVKEIEEYLQKKIPELVYDDRTAEVFQILSRPNVGNELQRFYARQAMAAAYYLLPDFAKDLYPDVSLHRQMRGIKSLKTIAPMLRWSVRNGAYARALRRLGREP